MDTHTHTHSAVCKYRSMLTHTHKTVIFSSSPQYIRHCNRPLDTHSNECIHHVQCDGNCVFCLQGHNSPGSRMSTYMDASNHQNPTGNTRPSNRKVNNFSLSLTWSCLAAIASGIWDSTPQVQLPAHCRHLHLNKSCFNLSTPKQNWHPSVLNDDDMVI